VRNSSGGRKVSSDVLAEESAVGYLLPFGKETIELILQYYVVTWPERKG
jgi:hypothetical protein